MRMFSYLLLYQDWGPLVLRIALGAAFVVHGYPKLFTSMRHGFAGWLTALGYRPGRFWGLAVGSVEFFGGIALLLGMYTELAAALIALNMFVAMTQVKWGHAKYVESEKMGWELDLIYFAAAVSLVFLGPGAYALDSYLGYWYS